jgi:hypothetical protein
LFKSLRGPSIGNHLGEPVVVTDAGGQFTIYPPAGDPYYLIVLHERGVAIVRSDQFERDGKITVQPWARLRVRFLPDERLQRSADAQSWSRIGGIYFSPVQKVQPEVIIPSADRWPELRLSIQLAPLANANADAFEFHYVPPRSAGLLRHVGVPPGGSMRPLKTTSLNLAEPFRTIDFKPGETTTVEIEPLNDEEFATIQSAAPTGQRTPNRSAGTQRREINLVIAKHVMLLDGKQIEWQDLEKSILALPDPSQAHLTLRFTPAGAKEHEAKIRERIQALNQKQRLRSPTWSTVDPSQHEHYDNLKPGLFDPRVNTGQESTLAPQRLLEQTPQRLQTPLPQTQRQ